MTSARSSRDPRSSRQLRQAAPGIHDDLEAAAGTAAQREYDAALADLVGRLRRLRRRLADEPVARRSRRARRLTLRALDDLAEVVTWMLRASRASDLTARFQLHRHALQALERATASRARSERALMSPWSF